MAEYYWGALSDVLAQPISLVKGGLPVPGTALGGVSFKARVIRDGAFKARESDVVRTEAIVDRSSTSKACLFLWNAEGSGP